MALFLINLIRVMMLAGSVALAALVVSMLIYRVLHACWPKRPLVVFFLKLYVSLAAVDILVFFFLFHQHAKH